MRVAGIDIGVHRAGQSARFGMLPPPGLIAVGTGNPAGRVRRVSAESIRGVPAPRLPVVHKIHLPALERVEQSRRSVSPLGSPRACSRP